MPLSGDGFLIISPVLCLYVSAKPFEVGQTDIDVPGLI